MSKIVKYQETVFDESLSIEDICDAIADGDSLAKFCSSRGLNFGCVRRWIRAEVDREDRYKQAVELRKEWAAQNLCEVVLNMASFDPKDIVDPRGEIKPISEWPPSARAALSSIEMDGRTGMPKAKFIDRLRAIEMMGKTIGMFSVDKTKISTEKTLSDLILEAARNDRPGDEAKDKEGRAADQKVAEDAAD